VKQEEALSLLLLNFISECAFSKVLWGRGGRIEVHGTHQILFYTDHVHLFGGKLNTINNSKGAPLDPSKEFGAPVSCPCV